MLFTLVSAAHAFCGAYVGAEGENLSNYASEVVVAREGRRTTLTLISDYEGDATEFALLLPVPEVLGPDDVGVVDPALLDWIDLYSVPRQVEYTCESAFSAVTTFGCGFGFGCSDSSLSGSLDTGAGVEASWSEHGYDFVVLSAEESSGLLGWLETNGYAVPAGGEAILQEYVDAGSYFLAARVSLDGTARDGEWLWPVQLTYETDVFSLPIRIGTISSTGAQELIIYTLTDPTTDGEVGIANYPQLDMPEECMLEEGVEFADWYANKLAEVHEDGGAGWIKEYSWELVPVVGTGYHCDPCTAEAVVPGGTFAPFGRNADNAHLTRLHMRYTPEQATEDLTLYISGVTGVQEQIKVVSPLTQLEGLFPYCTNGWAEDPGECPDAPVFRSSRTLGAAPFGVLLLAALLRRRRA